MGWLRSPFPLLLTSSWDSLATVVTPQAVGNIWKRRTFCLKASNQKLGGPAVTDAMGLESVLRWGKRQLQSHANLTGPTAFAPIIVVISGETCAIPNDDTLVGKADDKVNEHHSPQTGKKKKASYFESQKLDALRS